VFSQSSILPSFAINKTHIIIVNRLLIFRIEKAFKNTIVTKENLNITLGNIGRMI
jgi:hypothetical protein